MKVVILCGGQGTRLREETEFKPKPMVQIGDKPILWHIMRHYAHHGFKEFVLCLGYKGDVIRDYFLNFSYRNCDFTVTLGQQHDITLHTPPAELDWRVTLAETGQATLTGARVKKAARHLGGGPFMLTYGDAVADVDLRALLAAHQKSGRLATVTAVHPGKSRYGELESENDRVASFAEKPDTHQNTRISGGFFVFEPGFLDYLDDDEGCVLEQEPMQRLVQDGQLSVFHHTGYWQCMDTYRDTLMLNQLWQSGEAPWKVD